ncbi:nucleotide-sugar transporter-domain-containing protein [Pholiota molesta]|nr:nucleotide-sugar transporter-domain-containing protein [Pholiota molesta]
MHHRPLPTVRSLSSLSPSVVSSRAPTPRPSPLLPAASFGYPADKYDSSQAQQLHPLQLQQPTICGLPLKYVSLVTLAVQNAALSIVMHYSRVSIPPSLAYSPASAVLLNELLKGSISFIIALFRSPVLYQQPLTRRKHVITPFLLWTAFSDLCGEIFSPDCWKLSIPAILYVIQNSLQFVAISNLPVASFQVTYQMKILTTAAFSVALLRKKLTGIKWLALFFLAIGVGIVQIQSTVGTGHVISKPSPTAVGSAHEFHMHVMNPLKGFGAVTAACFTSGLAGVYFEMVLKGSKADLWVRNVSSPWICTSLSIVLSFLASVALFDFHITPSFVVGASTVLCATWMYNHLRLHLQRCLLLHHRQS